MSARVCGNKKIPHVEQRSGYEAAELGRGRPHIAPVLRGALRAAA